MNRLLRFFGFFVVFSGVFTASTSSFAGAVGTLYPFLVLVGPLNAMIKSPLYIMYLFIMAHLTFYIVVSSEKRIRVCPISPPTSPLWFAVQLTVKDIGHTTCSMSSLYIVRKLKLNLNSTHYM